MTSVRMVLGVSRGGLFFSTVLVKNQNCHISKQATIAQTMGIRNISSLEITKNLSLLSQDKIHNKVNNLKLEQPIDRPLVVMFSWLMARRKHIFKYADIYTSNGFDVLNISITPWQLLWPAKGTQMVAKDVLKFLDTNTSFSPLLLHGFSVGAYQWSEVLVQIASEKDRYQHVVDRIAGQIWDSAADITEIPIGLPFAVFPKNQVLQSALRQYVLYHLKTFDKIATCHYVRASQMYHTNLVRAPALFFISKTDPIGAEQSNIRAKENWEQMGIEVTWKCFESTPHVGHFRHYPEEYTSEIIKFIEKIGLSSAASRQKIQAKL